MRYTSAGAAEKLQAMFFDESGGGHDFPPGVRQQAYSWLDLRLKAS